MKENISCNIIQDLLPNYIEGIISNESKELIDTHLDKCVSCKKEFESMNSLLEVAPVKEREFDYLKGIHKKCKNILLICIILSCVAFILAIFNSEPNIDEAFFTLALYLMIIVVVIIKYLLSLFGAIVSILNYKKTKKK
ncbi:hypothetical protein UT300007_25020 [Clostridium sp. CTA-7]